jgi:hypothetical protein
MLVERSVEDRLDALIVWLQKQQQQQVSPKPQTPKPKPWTLHPKP